GHRSGDGRDALSEIDVICREGGRSRNNSRGWDPAGTGRAGSVLPAGAAGDECGSHGCVEVRIARWLRLCVAGQCETVSLNTLVFETESPVTNSSMCLLKQETSLETSSNAA